VHLFPHIIVRPRYVMVHPIFVKSTLHPTLHSVTTLMRECDAKPGMMWARRAADGRPGRSNVPVCVERYLIAVGQACNDRFLGRLDVGDMRTSGEKIAHCAGV
jgi:hypothetical protein